MSISGKNLHEVPDIVVFVGSNLNFTVRIFALGLAHDLDIYKKSEKPANYIILFKLIKK